MYKRQYVKSVFREFLNYQPEPYALSIGGSVLTEKAFLIAVCNAPQYGNNAYIAPHAKLSDGMLDITVVHSGSPLSTVLVGVDLLTGYIDRNTLIDTFRVSAATITRLGCGPVHIDGEPMMMDDILDIKCRHKALRLFTPREQDSFKPIVTPIKEMLRDARLSLNHLFNP